MFIFFFFHGLWLQANFPRIFLRHLSLAISAADQPNARVEASGPSWNEKFISPTASRTRTVVEAVERGHSVVLLHGLATPTECAALRSEASAFAIKQRDKMHPDAHPEYIRMPVMEMLGAQGQGRCDGLLLRALAALDETLPALVPTLLGDCVADRSTILHSPRLQFSMNEPAMNVYRAGGFFTPHQDHQSFTVLMPLSDRGDYGGGGTAFWAAEDGQAADRATPPALVLTPPPGTAIIFGGVVTHAGLPVTSGERIVFVASFIPCPVFPSNFERTSRPLL